MTQGEKNRLIELMDLERVRSLTESETREFHWLHKIFEAHTMLLFAREALKHGI